MTTEIKVGINAENVVPELNKIDAAIRRIHRNLNALKMAAKDAGISLPDLLSLEMKDREETVHMPDLLFHLFGISRSEGRRLITAGAAFVDKKCLTEADLDLPLSEVGDGTVIRLGSRRRVTLDGPLDPDVLERQGAKVREEPE